MTIALPLVVYDELEQQAEAMERDGFVYFPNLLSPDEVAELRRLSVQLEPSAEALDINLTSHRQHAHLGSWSRAPGSTSTH